MPNSVRLYNNTQDIQATTDRTSRRVKINVSTTLLQIIRLQNSFPHAEDPRSLGVIGKARYFSKIILASGKWQINDVEGELYHDPVDTQVARPVTGGGASLHIELEKKVPCGDWYYRQ